MLELIIQLRNKGVDLLLDDSGSNLRLVGVLKNLAESDKAHLRDHKQEIVSYLLEQDKTLARQYWEKQFESEQPLLDLSCFRTGASGESSHIELAHDFSGDFTGRLKAFATQHQAAGHSRMYIHINRSGYTDSKELS